MAWGADENAEPTNGNGNGNGLISDTLGGFGIGSGTEESPPGQAPTKPEPGPLDKVKTWSVGAGAVGAVALLAGSIVYWKYAKKPKGRKKAPSSVGRLIGIGGVSLGVSTLVASGLVIGATSVVEKKVKESPVLRALL